MNKIVLADVVSKELLNEFPADSEKLHVFLGSKQDYSDWIKNRINQYDFIENKDYIIESIKTKGRPKKLYWVTLDMVKELSMVENNAKGREARKYFIEIEKEYKKALEAPIKTSNITMLDMRRELTTARLRLTLEKKKHRATAEELEAKIAQLKNSTLSKENFQYLHQDLDDAQLRAFNLQKENAELKKLLVFVHNRFHEILTTCSVKDLQKTLLQMTNRFQMVKSIECNGNNLNTNTVAGHSYWE